MKVYTWDSVGMEWHNSTANVTSMPADPGSFLAKAAAPADDPYDEQVYGLMIGNRYARYGWFGGRGQYFLEILAEDDFKPKPINHDGPIGALADALGTDWLTIVGGHDKFMADMNEIWGEPRNFEIERERGQGKILYTWEHATTVIYNGESRQITVEIGYHSGGDRPSLSPGWTRHLTGGGRSHSGPSIYDGAKNLEIFRGLQKPERDVEMTIWWNNQQTENPTFKMHMTKEDNRKHAILGIKNLLETIPADDREAVIAEATK